MLIACWQGISLNESTILNIKVKGKEINISYEAQLLMTLQAITGFVSIAHEYMNVLLVLK